MATRRLLSSPAMRRQKLLAEFTGLSGAAPSGVYVCITPGNVNLWNGVMFIRPYATAILRFHILFPVQYPDIAPSITFTTHVFHPLLTPTTAQESGPGSFTNTQWLSPGGFSLRHGFPSWFKNQSRTSPAENSVISVYDVLDYIRTTFDDAEVLDSIDADAAVNPGALQAWQSYRSETANKSTSQTEQLSFAQTAMDNASWNWDGVWESRSRKGIEASLSDIVLYGGSNKDDELIRFESHEPEALDFIKENVKRSMES